MTSFSSSCVASNGSGRRTNRIRLLWAAVLVLSGALPVSALKQPQFIQAFAKKGRFKDWLERIPVRVITARGALVGAASFGPETYKHTSGAAA